MTHLRDRVGGGNALQVVADAGSSGPPLPLQPLNSKQFDAVVTLLMLAAFQVLSASRVQHLMFLGFAW